MAKKKYLKLTTPSDVRKSINRVTNLLLNGEIEPKTANALIYGCNSVLNSIRTDEINRKIEEIENFLADSGITIN